MVQLGFYFECNGKPVWSWGKEVSYVGLCFVLKWTDYSRSTGEIERNTGEAWQWLKLRWSQWKEREGDQVGVYILKLVLTLKYVYQLGRLLFFVELDIGAKERTIQDGPEGFSLSRWLRHLLRWKRLEKRLIWGVSTSRTFSFDGLSSLSLLLIIQMVLSSS